MSAFIECMIENKKKTMMVLIAVVLLGLVVWSVWENTALELNSYIVDNAELPKVFEGFRIAHVSDLHNARMGKDNETLLAMLREAKPDIIAITGDLIDSRNTDVEVALAFAMEAVRIAPCFYVTGNHEARMEICGELKMGLEAVGVTVLENEKYVLERAGERITVMGVEDPSFQTGYLLGDATAVISAQLSALTDAADGFTVLLSHRPELFETYAQYDMDLVLSGHAHGGQFRLPFVGGLIAPNQGLLPKYDAGLYTQGNTKMVVSRGIGNSLFPLRFNNPPEVILVELHSGS